MKTKSGYSYQASKIILGIVMLVASLATTLVAWPNGPTRTAAFALPYNLGPRLSETAQQVSAGDFSQMFKSGGIKNARSVVVFIDRTQRQEQVVDLVQGENSSGVAQAEVVLGRKGFANFAYTMVAPPKIDNQSVVVDLVNDRAASGWMVFPILLWGLFVVAGGFAVHGRLTKDETDRIADRVVYFVLGGIFWLVLAIWVTMSF